MSELFDSLNCNGSAGPSSSQSSSQPSASKVYWHTSPSPAGLQQLRSMSKWGDQCSPTLPLCTQAFVGELRKFPISSSLHSPLVSKSGAKRKSTSGFSRGHHLGTALSDDDDDESDVSLRSAAVLNDRGGKTAGEPRRLLLDEHIDSSPESRSRRTLNAGCTGRLRDPSPDSLSTISATSLSDVASKRTDRRSVRRRKKESFVAGLGLAKGKETNCLKLFEDLEAVIQDMNSNPPEQYRARTTNPQSPPLSQRSQQEGKLTPRALINRTSSAPTPVEKSQSQTAGTINSASRRLFVPTKSDHDVFKASLASQAQQREVFRLTTNEPAREASQRAPCASQAKLPLVVVTDDVFVSADKQDMEDLFTVTKVVHASPPAPNVKMTASANPGEAQISPLKRSARIEAMHQHGSTGKKLGVRASPSIARSRTESPVKPPTSAAKPQRSRSNGLAGISQARQPGLPRHSQFTSSQAQTTANSVISRSGSTVGPRAPFRPPARALQTSTGASVSSPSNDSSSRRKRLQPSSSDDSFPDEDDDFLALAAELGC